MNGRNENGKNYVKRILIVAIPIMLSNLISQLQMLIDRIFIGRISLDCMSAVGNATSPMWTSMNIVFSVATGATILVSQAYGAGEIEKAKEILASVFKYNNVLGILLFLFWFFWPELVFHLMREDESIIGMSIDYARYFSPIFILMGLGASISCMLEASQRTKIMIWYGVVRSLANVALDYVMIFGRFGFPAMGVKGAALATTIAELIGDMIVLFYVLFAKDMPLRPAFDRIVRSKAATFLRAIRFGAPAACEEFAWNMGNLYLIVMLNQVSVDAAGIHSIIFGVELLAVVLVGSIGVATLSLSGYETGKKNVRGVWDVVMCSCAMCLTISVFNLILFLLIPRQILGIFTTDETVILAAPVYLLIVGLDLFPKSGNIIVGSGIKGYGEPSWMLKTQLFGTAFVVAASSLLVLGLHRGIMAIFAMVVVDETLRFILNFRKLCRVRREAEQQKEGAG